MVPAVFVLALIAFAIVAAVAFFASLAHRRWGLAAAIFAGSTLPFLAVIGLVVGFSHQRMEVASAELKARVKQEEEAVKATLNARIREIERAADRVGRMGDAVGRVGDRVGDFGDRIGNQVDEWVDGAPPVPPIPPAPTPPPKVTDAIEEMDAAGVSVPQIDMGDDSPEVEAEVNTDDGEPGNLFETLKTATVVTKEGDRPAWVDDPPASDEHTVRGVVRSVPSPSRDAALEYAADARCDWLWERIAENLGSSRHEIARQALRDLSGEAVAAPPYVEPRELSVGTVYVVHELLEYDREDEADFLAEVELRVMSARRAGRSQSLAVVGAAVLGALGVTYTALKAGQPKA